MSGAPVPMEGPSAPPPVAAPDAPHSAVRQRTLGRDIALVARFELGEALRSRLLVVMILLFVGGGVLGAWGYTRLISTLEEKTAQMMGAPEAKRPGGTIKRLRDSRNYRDVLMVFLRDEAKADYYAALPPIVVFFGWASFMFTPWLILFTSAETIASEVASRSIRFSVMRTGRLELALGKMAGQALIIAGVTALSAVAFYLVAWGRLDGFEHRETALGLLSYWPRVMLYSLPFLAWALLASMVSSSVNVARIVSLGGGVVLGMLSGLADGAKGFGWREGPVGDAVWLAVRFIVPFGHYEGLSYPPGGGLPADLALCLTLTVLYFGVGFLVLRKRDL